MRPARCPPPLAGTAARLALRQQNLRALLPVLLHEVNGSLNGLSLSTELLSRVLPNRESAEASANAANLLQRSRNELGRLKQALKGLELRLLQGSDGPPATRRTPFAAMLHDLQSMLMPAVRRGQLEWHLVLEAGVEEELALRPEDAFDLLAAFRDRRDRCRRATQRPRYGGAARRSAARHRDSRLGRHPGDARGRAAPGAAARGRRDCRRRGRLAAVE